MQINLEEFDSNEEIYFYWYLQDLARLGYIDSFSYESENFALGEDVDEEVHVELKTKTKVEFKPLMKARSYTPDFKIQWRLKAVNVFCRMIGDPKANRNAYFLCDENLVSLIEIKPHFDQHGKTVMSRLKIDWVFFQHRKYVQVVIPTASVDIRGKITPKSALFPSTFTPLRYFKTDGGGRDRNIKWPTKTIEEFTSTLNK